MTDMYVYYFTGLPGSATETTISNRPATLAAIRGLGEPIMESQLVVDHTEVDVDGFHNPDDGMRAYVLNDFAAQIVSLELRALSRDREGANLNDGEDRYMLSLESRELRKQARAIKTTADNNAATNDPDVDSFEGLPSPG